SEPRSGDRLFVSGDSDRPRPTVRESSGVAFEFRTIELGEHVAGGLVEQATTLGRDASPLAFGGLDQSLFFELLERGTDDLPAALGGFRRSDRVPIRATLRAAVGGREP